MIDPRGQAVATAALMMTAYTRCQATGPKPAASSRRVDPPLGARLAGPAEDQRRDEPPGELIDQNEMATGDQNPVALGQSRLLVRPVIERGHADHQVERAVPERQVLGHADREPQPLVAGNEQGRGRGDLDHSRRRVDPGQFGGARAAAGQQPEQIAAPAADIEHSLGRRGWRSARSRRFGRRCRDEAGRAIPGHIRRPAHRRRPHRGTWVARHRWSSKPPAAGQAGLPRALGHDRWPQTRGAACSHPGIVLLRRRMASGPASRTSAASLPHHLIA